MNTMPVSPRPANVRDEPRRASDRCAVGSIAGLDLGAPQPQPSPQNRLDRAQLRRVEFAQNVQQPRMRNRDDALRVERAGLEKPEQRPRTWSRARWWCVERA